MYEALQRNDLLKTWNFNFFNFRGIFRRQISQRTKSTKMNPVDHKGESIAFKNTFLASLTYLDSRFRTLFFHQKIVSVL